MSMPNSNLRLPMPALVLASTSRYRAELLARLGLPFTTMAPEVDETPLPGENPADLARRLARAKAQAVAMHHPGAVVIGSDQVAICRGRLMGKPGSASKALEQLQWQRGQQTEFISAVAVVGPLVPAPLENAVVTTVVWRAAEELTDERLARYIELENPVDCAGAAKSECLGIGLLKAISSDDPTALVGLPLIWLVDALLQQGIDPLRSS